MSDPVGWASSLDFDDDDQEIIPAKDKGKLGTSNCDIPLYTAPQKREWVWLTVDEVYECWKTGDVVAAVEAKLKEKNA